MITKTPLTLHEELLLLALHDEKGTFSGGFYTYALGGAMVSELLLQERILANDDKKRTVAVINDDVTGDPLLDELLREMIDSKKHKGLQDWVYAAARIKRLGHRIAASLCSAGILQRDERKVLFLFTRQVFPELDSTWEDSVRTRMAATMFDPDVEPDVRTAVLIAFASHCNLLKPNFAPVELKQHRQRIKELANGDLLATEATKAAIQAVQSAVMVATMIPVIITTTS